MKKSNFIIICFITLILVCLCLSFVFSSGNVHANSNVKNNVNSDNDFFIIPNFSNTHAILSVDNDSGETDAHFGWQLTGGDVQENYGKLNNSYGLNYLEFDY